MTAAVTTASGADADAANRIESAWSKLKALLLDASTEVCGLSKNHQWKPEAWWGSEEEDKAIQEKCAWFKVYSDQKIRDGGQKRAKQPTLMPSTWQNMPRKVLLCASRSLGVKEWTVRVIEGMYSNGSMVNTVRSLAQELVCIRVLSLAYCSSCWCWRHCCVNSTLVYHGNSSTLMTWCLRTPKKSLFPSSRHGRLTWEVKSFLSTWRRPSCWSLVMARMSSRNLASTHVLSALVVSTEIHPVLTAYAVGPQDVQWHS